MVKIAFFGLYLVCVVCFLAAFETAVVVYCGTIDTTCCCKQLKTNKFTLEGCDCKCVKFNDTINVNVIKH